MPSALQFASTYKPKAATPTNAATHQIAITANKPKTTSTYKAPASTGKTAAQLAAEALAAYLASLQGSSGGGDYGSYETSMPSYNPQAYNVNLPTIDWSFNPTAEQRTGWNTQATATAAQEIDPQLQAIKTALQQYMAQGQNTRNELNPRYTNQSLGIANIIQNSVKQEAINNAIRRGAEQSGWLPSALMEAGQTEAEQRGAVETQRNADLAALAALEAQQTQAAGEQSTTLEGLRGSRITTALADLENQEWERKNQEKLNQWNSAVGREQLKASAYGANASNQLAGYQTLAGVSQGNADRALQAAIAENEQKNTQWSQNYQTSQDTYQRALDAAKLAQSGISSKTKEPTYTYNGIPGLSLEQYLYYLDKDKQYAANNKSSSTSSLEELIAKYLK